MPQAMTREEIARSMAISRLKRQMKMAAREAFTETSMMENASIIVWTKGQMRGLRSVIKRLKMVG